jgi:hypothetical protein
MLIQPYSPEYYLSILNTTAGPRKVWFRYISLYFSERKKYRRSKEYKIWNDQQYSIDKLSLYIAQIWGELRVAVAGNPCKIIIFFLI